MSVEAYLAQPWLLALYPWLEPAGTSKLCGCWCEQATSSMGGGCRVQFGNHKAHFSVQTYCVNGTGTNHTPGLYTNLTPPGKLSQRKKDRTSL